MTPGAIADVATVLAATAFPALAADSEHDMSQLMRGALGPYAMTRESSGTSWQPDASVHAGLHSMHGDWMLMDPLTRLASCQSARSATFRARGMPGSALAGYMR